MLREVAFGGISVSPSVSAGPGRMKSRLHRDQLNQHYWVNGLHGFSRKIDVIEWVSRFFPGSQTRLGSELGIVLLVACLE